MRKSISTDQYFGEKEEKAVTDYIRSESAEEKNLIYNTILKEPFKKMIQSILRKYPIHIGNYEIEEVEENVLTHLIEHMVKFNPDKITKSGKKTKAFSYCQTIVRNYYKDHSWRSFNEKKTNLCFDDYFDEIENKSEFYYEEDNETHDGLDKLISNVIDDIDEKLETDSTIKRNELIVGDAIINVLRNWDVLFVEDSPVGKYDKKLTNKFAKNKILLFLKEQTGLSTKEIRLAIKPFREIYFGKKNDLFDDEQFMQYLYVKNDMRPVRKKIRFDEESLNELVQELYDDSHNIKAKIIRLFTKWETRVKEGGEIAAIGDQIVKLIAAEAKNQDQKIMLLKYLKEIVFDKNGVGNSSNKKEEEVGEVSSDDRNSLLRMVRESIDEKEKNKRQ